MLKIRSKPIAFLVMLTMVLASFSFSFADPNTGIHMHQVPENVTRIQMNFTTAASIDLIEGNGNKWDHLWDQNETGEAYQLTNIILTLEGGGSETYYYTSDTSGDIQANPGSTDPFYLTYSANGGVWNSGASVNFWFKGFKNPPPPPVTPGSITINKDVLVDGDDRTAFTFNVFEGIGTAGALVSTVEAAEGSPVTVNNLTPAAYTVVEIATDGYSVSGSAVQTNIEVTAGANKDVYFENTKIIKPAYDVEISKTGPSTAKEGDLVTFNITVTNSGAGTLNGISVEDLNAQINITYPESLKSGESFSITAVATMPGVQLNNTATVFTNETTSKSSTWTVNLQTQPPNLTYEIDLVKSANVTQAALEDEITYTLVFTNTGSAVLYNITVIDQMSYGHSHMVAVTPGPLQPGESYTTTYSITVTENRTFPLINTALATGYSEDRSQYATDSATWTIYETGTPPPPPNPTPNSISIDKTVNISSMAEPGGTFLYTFVVTNNGPDTVILTSVEDDALGSITLPEDTTLAQGESSAPMTKAAVHSTAGSYINHVTATAITQEREVEGEGWITTSTLTAIDQLTVYVTPTSPPPPGDDDDDYTPPTTIIPPEPTPLAPITPTEEPVVLVEEATPLAALPQTGETDPLIFLGLGALLALAGYRLTRKAEEKQ